MLTNLHLGRGATRGALTVFPIWHERTFGPAVALADGTNLVVSEAEVPTVPSLQVTARGPSPVLLLDGDLLIGGLQNRVAVGSVLLRPGMTATIEVRCVEPDRWYGGGSHQVGDLRSTALIRSEIDQYTVWENVAHEESRNGGARPTIDDLAPLPGQSGVLIGIGGWPTLMEVFADEQLLEAGWDQVLDAAAREATGRREKPTAAHRGREFMALVDNLKPKRKPLTVGIGRRVVGKSGPLELRGIHDGHRLLHATVLNHAALERPEKGPVMLDGGVIW
jgi:hypothetical protein